MPSDKISFTQRIENRFAHLRSIVEKKISEMKHSKKTTHAIHT